jgi:hypothetical protein
MQPIEQGADEFEVIILTDFLSSSMMLSWKTCNASALFAFDQGITRSWIVYASRYSF